MALSQRAYQNSWSTQRNILPWSRVVNNINSSALSWVLQFDKWLLCRLIDYVIEISKAQKPIQIKNECHFMLTWCNQLNIKFKTIFIQQLKKYWLTDKDFVWIIRKLEWSSDITLKAKN